MEKNVLSSFITFINCFEIRNNFDGNFRSANAFCRFNLFYGKPLTIC